MTRLLALMIFAISIALPHAAFAQTQPVFDLQGVLKEVLKNIPKDAPERNISSTAENSLNKNLPDGTNNKGGNETLGKSNASDATWFSLTIMPDKTIEKKYIRGGPPFVLYLKKQIAKETVEGMFGTYAVGLPNWGEVGNIINNKQEYKVIVVVKKEDLALVYKLHYDFTDKSRRDIFQRPLNL